MRALELPRISRNGLDQISKERPRYSFLRTQKTSAMTSMVSVAEVFL
jgi:hypothetical protein